MTRQVVRNIRPRLLAVTFRVVLRVGDQHLDLFGPH
jgi:hypothetical protein